MWRRKAHALFCLTPADRACEGRSSVSSSSVTYPQCLKIPHVEVCTDRFYIKGSKV